MKFEFQVELQFLAPCANKQQARTTMGREQMGIQKQGRDRNRAGAETIQRIMEAAERLFSKVGFAETSLKDITDAANVNIAAVNYHFGSKESLYAAILDRQFGPILAQRVTGLDAVCAAAQQAGVAPSLEPLLAAWIDPLLGALFRSDGSGRFLLDLELESSRAIERGEVVDWPRPYAECRRQFRLAVLQACPQLPEADVNWRLEFLCTCVLPTLRAPASMDDVTGCDVRSPAPFRDAWLAAGRALLGLEAPSATAT